MPSRPEWKWSLEGKDEGGRSAPTAKAWGWHGWSVSPLAHMHPDDHDAPDRAGFFSQDLKFQYTGHALHFPSRQHRRRRPLSGCPVWRLETGLGRQCYLLQSTLAPSPGVGVD